VTQQRLIAVVTGASRGIGKGIALELGALGATVFATGRTVAAGGVLPGTVGETAQQVTDLGGRGIGVACDHHDDAQVEALFARVLDEEGRIDVLVNNVFSAPAFSKWLGKPFWELPVEAWDEVIDVGLRSHYVAARCAAPAMIAQGDGLIVNVSSSGAIQYAHVVSYGVGKAALDRMTADMAHELAPYGSTVVSVWPGLVRTELVMLGAQAGEDGTATITLPGEGVFDLSQAESPRFTGRAVAALASDPYRHARTGRAFTVAQLAADYGFTDVDGSVPRTLLRPDSPSRPRAEVVVRGGASLTATVQEWVGETGPEGTSALIARRHIAAETSTDVDAICATISPDVFFAVPVRTRAGQELRDGTVLTDPGQVRKYYEGRSGSYVVTASAQIKSVTTSWYAFNESAATLLGTGDVNGVDAAGLEWVVNSAVLFPTAPDGIRGEICATRHPMDDVILGAVPPHAEASAAHGVLLDRMASALRSGDWADAAAELGDRHSLAVRLDPVGAAPRIHTGNGRDQSRDQLSELFGGAKDLTFMVRLATDWYLFAEYLLGLDSGRHRRLALIQPVEDGRVIGTFGYGRDERP